MLRFSFKARAAWLLKHERTRHYLPEMILSNCVLIIKKKRRRTWNKLDFFLSFGTCLMFVSLLAGFSDIFIDTINNIFDNDYSRMWFHELLSAERFRTTWSYCWSFELENYSDYCVQPQVVKLSRNLGKYLIFRFFPADSKNISRKTLLITKQIRESLSSHVLLDSQIKIDKISAEKFATTFLLKIHKSRSPWALSGSKKVCEPSTHDPSPIMRPFGDNKFFIFLKDP